MRKKKLKLLPKIIIICMLGIIFFTIYNLFNTPLNKESTTIKNNKLDINKEKVSNLSLVMVGDALIHDDIYNDARTSNGYDFTKMLEPIKSIVSNYDLAYYNQETILGGSEIGVSSYPAFNSPYEVGDAFLDAGFNLVSLATNHTLDRGEKAVINSRNYWNSKDNVLAVGSYASNEGKEKIRILTKNDITYAMLNYTYGTNGIKVPNEKEYLVNVWPVTGVDPNNDKSYENYKEIVKQEITSVREKIDLLIVAMHWGVEYQLSPNAYQKDMAKFLSDLGVDIIIGTHPHVIQPIEWIDDTLVIYSLGNFISAHEIVNMDNRIGLMTSVEITKRTYSNNEVDISLNNLNNELLYTYYTNDYKNFKVIPFSNLTDEYLSNYKSIGNKYVDIIKSIDNTIKVNAFN